MNNFAVGGLLLLMGVCAYAAINHAVIAFSKPYSRMHLLFAIVCVLLIAFEFLHGLTYTATTLDEFVPRLKWEISSILLFLIVFSWFVGEYSGLRSQWMQQGFTGLFAVLILANSLHPYSLQYSTLTQLEHVTQPWGETIALPVGVNGLGFFLAVVVVILNFSFAIYALAKNYYESRLLTALWMLLAIGIWTLSSVEGILVRMGALDFIHLGPYGMLGMIFAMSLALSQEMRNKLTASEQRFRSLVEQSPFSIQVLSPSGVTLQVNQAWETLWGVSLEHISNYNMLQDQQMRDKGIMPFIEQGFAGQATEIPPINYNPAENLDVTGPPRDRWVRAFIYPVKDEADAVREVVLLHEDVTDKKRLDDAIRLMASGVSSSTGENYFRQLVLSLSQLFGTSYAFIGVLESTDAQLIQTLAVSVNLEPATNFRYELNGTPCATVMGQHTCAYPRDVQRLFPEDHLLEEMSAEGYLGTPLFDAKGNPLGIIVLLDRRPLQDVEQMKAIMEIFAVRAAAEIERNRANELMLRSHDRLQEIVDKRTVELQRAVKELETFSYSVSHDLRAPLRTIDGFGQALMEEYASVLDEQGRDYLKRICNSAQRMALLIDKLLQFSRVTNVDLNVEPINLSKLVRNSLDKYQAQDPSRKVDFTIDENIVVNGDYQLLEIVIDNLLSNAWKYTSKEPHPSIEFGCQNQNGKKIYYIQDNGAGFEMKYADKLFNAFQRLHSAQDFEGNGIGLATVARILKRHGGEIWADAHPQQGAVFYFCLSDTQ